MNCIKPLFIFSCVKKKTNVKYLRSNVVKTEGINLILIILCNFFKLYF